MKKFIVGPRTLRRMLNDQKDLQEIFHNTILNHRERFIRCREFAESCMDKLAKAHALADLYKQTIQINKIQAKKLKHPSEMKAKFSKSQEMEITDESFFNNEQVNRKTIQEIHDDLIKEQKKLRNAKVSVGSIWEGRRLTRLLRKKKEAVNSLLDLFGDLENKKGGF